MEDAAHFAEESPEPDPDELYDDVIVDAGAIAWRTSPARRATEAGAARL